ncbi:type II toxin-antitoxin system RelE family toxin [Actinomadura soli]|uniref:type II toxin-antitoxin system RelE family toxin n=1 Tax=Actinomadura soli TaxID=2508997 RepID=UPI0014860F2C|nr:type II toxin-antitoxin system RelE/ParE family toxin [Actinomadura soli]
MVDMTAEWSPQAQRTMRRYMHDQQGMHAIATAVNQLVDDPRPPDAFSWGSSDDYRLRVGPYRVLHRLSDGIIHVAHISRTAT